MKTKKMKTQFKVINRTTRIEQILNASEVARFFKLNSIKEYAISTINQKYLSLLKNL
jgi:hypothetical protein